MRKERDGILTVETAANLRVSARRTSAVKSTGCHVRFALLRVLFLWDNRRTTKTLTQKKIDWLMRIKVCAEIAQVQPKQASRMLLMFPHRPSLDKIVPQLRMTLPETERRI